MSKLINIPYLEISDLSSPSSVGSHVSNGRPVVVMIQAEYCGYCTRSKPDFQKLAEQTPNINVVTIQADDKFSGRQVIDALNSAGIQIPGYPTYIGFDKSGKFAGFHEGGRDVRSLQEFASSL